MFAFFRRARKSLTRALAFASIVALAACDGPPMLGAVGGNTGKKIDPSQPVPVALLLPKGLPDAAPVAQSLENAARLAIANLGGQSIDLRVYDTGGNAAQAAQVAQRAVDEGAAVILGPLFAEAANAAGLAVRDEGVNVLSFSNNESIAGGNVFVLGPTFGNTANRLARYARKQGKTRAVVAYPNNVEGQTGAAAIRQAAASNGIQIASAESFSFSQAGVTEAVPRIASAVKTTGADALFMTSNSAGALPMLAELLPSAGVSGAVTQYIGLSRWDVPAQTLALPGLQGGWFALPDQAMQRNFSDRYRASYGSAPHPLAGLAFDGIAAIGALTKAGRSDALTTRGLTQGAGFQGTGGAFRLLPSGKNERALAIATIRDQKLVILEPAPRSFSGAGF